MLSFLLTRGGPPGPAALATARALLERGGSLDALALAGEAELLAVPGIGPGRASRVRACLALAQRLAGRPLARGAPCGDPSAIWGSFRGRAGRLRQERAWVILLDTRMRKIAELEIARGRRNCVAIDPAEFFGPALREGASGVLLVHNHPSGDPAPGAEDVELTRRLQAAGDLLGVPLFDHVVVAADGFVSLAELGHLPRGPLGFAVRVAS